jgi:hypothetical protein
MGCRFEPRAIVVTASEFAAFLLPVIVKPPFDAVNKND